MGTVRADIGDVDRTRDWSVQPERGCGNPTSGQLASASLGGHWSEHPSLSYLASILPYADCTTPRRPGAGHRKAAEKGGRLAPSEVPDDAGLVLGLATVAQPAGRLPLRHYEPPPRRSGGDGVPECVNTDAQQASDDTHSFHGASASPRWTPRRAPGMTASAVPRCRWCTRAGRHGSVRDDAASPRRSTRPTRCSASGRPSTKA